MFWRETFFNINVFYRERALEYRKYIEEFDFPFNAYRKEMIKLLRRWMGNYEDISPNKIAGLKWILQKVTSVFAIYHFYNWLLIAKENAHLNYRPRSIENNFSHIPFFAIYFPPTLSQPIQFFTYKNEHNLIINSDLLDLICPYKEGVIKRDKNEESHHQ